MHEGNDGRTAWHALRRREIGMREAARKVLRGEVGEKNNGVDGNQTVKKIKNRKATMGEHSRWEER